jgi:hypothetical protein
VLAEKVYIGSRLDLEHYKGIAIQEHEFELLDIDGEPIDLSIYDSVYFDLYTKPHGRLLDSTEITQITQPNFIYLNQGAEVYERRATLYFFECKAYQSASPDDVPTILFYGNFDLI